MINRNLLLTWGIILIILVFFAYLGHDIARREELSMLQINQIKPGMLQTEVEQILGEPHELITSTHSGVHHWEGYSHDGHTISHLVMIYPMPPDMVLYIYIDPANTVEHLFVGKS